MKRLYLIINILFILVGTISCRNENMEIKKEEAKMENTKVVPIYKNMNSSKHTDSINSGQYPIVSDTIMILEPTDPWNPPKK